jgi:Mg-chelatase subunit ChlD/uncharacterized membrane protein
VRLANPAGLFLLALAIPIILLHILRPRRQQQEVSSTFLWRSVAQPVSAASPWQRLRPSVLLALQLLAVALLALTAARPVRVEPAGLAEHTVFIIDASGSMAAKDGSPDRLAAAKAEARRLHGRLPASGIASIVVASDRPTVALTASADTQAFDEALGPIKVTAGTADWADAFLLAESLETTDAQIGFEIVSDGGLTDADQRLIPPGSHYTRVGERSTNRAITKLTVEPRGSGLHARATVANTGGGDATQQIRFDVDGKTATEQQVSLPAGSVFDVDVDLPAGDRVEAFLQGDDLLDADDHAFAVAARRRPLEVLLAGPADPFLETLLGAVDGVTVERVASSVTAAGYDLAIYDRVDVPVDPQAPFLAIAPPSGAPGIVVSGSVERPAVTLVQPDDPLVEGLDLSSVAIAAAQQLDGGTATVVVGSDTTPLLLRSNLDGRPFAYLGFALGDSNLPLQVSFPILVDRLLTDLASATLPPGDLVVGRPLPVEPGTAATVDAPGGASIDVVPGAPAPIATRTGFWAIESTGRPERIVAVNADPAESTLAPAPSLLTPERQERPGEKTAQGESSLRAWVVWPLLAVVVLEFLAARRKLGVTRRQWRWAVALRVLVVALLVGALLDIALIRPAQRVATVFVIDASDSVGASGKTAAVSWAADAIRQQPSGALAGVVLFGGDARLELTVQHDAELGQPAVRIDPTRTNLATALRLAAAVLPTDAKRRVVLVSDGRATAGDVTAEATRLHDAGIQVDVHLVARQGGADVAVASLDAPGLARAGERIPLLATITAGAAGPVQLTLLRDGEVVDQRTIDVPAGTSTVDLGQVAEDAGLARYQVRIAAAQDAIVENDTAYAAVQIEGPARVLVLEGRAGNASALAEALQAGGIGVDVMAAAALPPLDAVATYSAVVLVDVDVHSLTDDQVKTLAASTRDLGHGLVTLGGDQSYGLGGYLDSSLEELLPVISEITDPKRRESVAEVLAIDSSGSMGACHCSEGNMQSRLGGGVQKDDIAKAAAARTIDALTAQDEIGVLAFNTEAKWIVDLQTLPSEQVVEEGLAHITPQGGTNLRLSLTTAAAKLEQSKATLKHIILFTDGFTDTNAFGELAAQAAELYEEKGITVSVLATGEGAATDLQRIAEAGHGRFYPGRDLQQIPQIMVEEARLAARNFVNEGTFFPTVTSSAEPVRDLTESPPLLGYVATTAKPSASTMLRIGPDQDPLLATWRVGLGTATSWTSDASARWSQQWASWDGYVSFWSGVVKDTFADTGGGSVRARVQDGVLHVTVEGEATFPDGAVATARVTSPDLSTQEVRLERTAGDTFSGDVPVSQAGSYAVGASVATGDSTVASGSTLATLSYAAEYAPGEADQQRLDEISALTGGRGEIEASQAFDGGSLLPGRSRHPLAVWFILAAALLWPLAVALSRLALRGAGIAALRERTAWLGWAARSARARLPARPGADPRPRPVRPPKPGAARAKAKAQRREETAAAAKAPPATVGRLLDRKRAGRGEPSNRP